jgi:hypothetical protein
MKRIYIVFFALMATILCACSPISSGSAPAAASPAASPTATVAAMNTAEMEKMIIELEKKSWEPVKNQSPEEAKRFNAPGYRAIYFGAIKGEEESANDNKDIVLKSISFSDWKVSFPVKDTAIVTYKYDAVSTYKGKATGGPSVATSTWVNIAGEWKLAVYAEARAAQEIKK